MAILVMVHQRGEASILGEARLTGDLIKIVVASTTIVTGKLTDLPRRTTTKQTPTMATMATIISAVARLFNI
jgi:hypothetical protein